MTSIDTGESDLLERARAWRNAVQAAICDVIEPWEHGTIVRSTRYPSYYDFNVVRVEDGEPIAADALVATADRALAPLRHRRISFDHVSTAEPLRAGFEASGWKVMRVLWLRHEGPLPALASAHEVETVPYDAVDHLRRAWHGEDHPGIDPTSFHRAAREVARRRGAVVLAVREHGEAVAFAQLDGAGDGAGDGVEISHVYVQPDRRGGGRGTAVTCAAIRAARGARDVWICADDEDRPKHLYARLGFRPVWTTIELERVL
jgi:GNAT superfamily N-acetyltransferase